MRTAVAYIRVSTAKQGRAGIGLDAQRVQIQQYAKDRGFRIKRVFSEVASAMGDKKVARPILIEAILASRKFKCPILVTNLDRLSRDVSAVVALMERYRLKIQVANLDAQANEVVIRSEVKKAQFVGEEISRRTKEGLARMKASGVRLGNLTNLKDAQEKGAMANRKLAIIRKDDFAKALFEAQALGAETAKEIAAALNQIGFPTARGGAWTPENVYRNIGNQKTNGVRAASKPDEPASGPAPLAGPDQILTPAGVDRVQKAILAAGRKPPALGGHVPLKLELLNKLEKMVALHEQKAAAKS